MNPSLDWCLERLEYLGIRLHLSMKHRDELQERLREAKHTWEVYHWQETLKSVEDLIELLRDERNGIRNMITASFEALKAATKS